MQERPVTVAIQCDRCKKIYESVMERQEFLCWSDTCGYGNSTFGDMTKIGIDLCQYCVHELLSPWMRVTDDPTPDVLAKLAENKDE